ncbi:YtxH domain-containing protein [Mucilaginibacter sp. HMF5004]|uniref:YtxH domain-containing protein n=1 Tax=Mucilaginibacter rivuli TaxID=2857527 RepID=UPI001C5D2DD8|nr:YtxH domain-containing protein [Mucilaginibacter rivuli]MBW4889061.1 YtxH domain-containing protein [Mucilaginibacter rivuli]
MSSTSKSAALLLAGVAAGITLGMLFAPRKGSENREKLSNSVKNLSGNAANKFDELVGFTGGLVVSMLNNNADMYQYDDVEHAII